MISFCFSYTYYNCSQIKPASISCIIHFFLFNPFNRFIHLSKCVIYVFVIGCSGNIF